MGRILKYGSFSIVMGFFTAYFIIPFFLALLTLSVRVEHATASALNFYTLYHAWILSRHVLVTTGVLLAIVLAYFLFLHIHERMESALNIVIFILYSLLFLGGNLYVKKYTESTSLYIFLLVVGMVCLGIASVMISHINNCWHNWDGCKCRYCSKVRDKHHDWDGCECRRCGKIRDEQHNRDGCTCKKCGKSIHEWTECKCLRCGLTRDEDRNWIKKYYSMEPDYRANKEIRTITCPDCDGFGVDPSTYSQQSGQGGSNPCSRCGGGGTVTEEVHISPKDNGNIYEDCF